MQRFPVAAPAPSIPFPTVRPRRRASHKARIVRDLAGLTGLQQAWEALTAAATSPMQHYIWARACAETFAAARLRVVAVESQGEIVAIAPLRARGGFPTKLELLGVTELYEPTDLLYADGAALAALAETLADMGLPLRLGRLPAYSPVIGALEKACKGWVTTARVSSCPYIELGPEWTSPEQQFNAGRRSDLRRAERNASKLGKVTYEMVLTPSPDELNGLLDEAYRVEAAGWKGDGGSAMAVDQLRGAFFRTYAAAARRRGILRLAFMRIDGEAVAMQLAVECGERFWLFKIGHDEQFARCSPGSLLMLYTVRYAALRGLRHYEFLGAEAPWTQGWTRTVRSTVSLRSYPPSVQGSAALSVDAANRIGMSLQRFVRLRRLS